MKTKLVNIAIILLMFVVTLIAIAYLPDTVPVHFDAFGNPDRMGSKYELLLIPASLVFVLVLSEISVGFFTKKLGNSDDEKQLSDAKTNEKTLNLILTITSAFMAVINCGIIYTTFASLDSYELPEVDMIKFTFIIVGAMLIAMGNFMPKTRSNSLLGFRTKWSMYNDNTWRRSNLIGGYTMMIVGVLVALSGLIFDGFTAAIVTLGLLTCAIAVMLIISYNIYKGEKNNENLFEK